jgi:hypothetical protein
MKLARGWNLKYILRPFYAICGVPLMAVFAAAAPVSNKSNLPGADSAISQPLTNGSGASIEIAGLAPVLPSVVVAPDGSTLFGYGFSGSANSQNRSVQEATIGFTNTFWKDAKYGALQLMGQYSYFTRNPWFVASGAPKNTHMNEVRMNLRYALPGSAPSLK